MLYPLKCGFDIGLVNRFKVIALHWFSLLALLLT